MDKFVVKVEENGKTQLKLTDLTKKILIGIAIAFVVIAFIVLIVYIVKRSKERKDRETFVLYSNENADHTKVNITPEVTYLESYINSALGFSSKK